MLIARSYDLEAWMAVCHTNLCPLQLGPGLGQSQAWNRPSQPGV